MSGQNFQLKLKQTQQLSQGLQQSLRVLQMSGLELEHEVEEWLQDNPLLERSEAPEGSPEPERISAAISKAGQVGGDDAEDIWATIAAEEDFLSYLHNQVCEHPLSREEAARVHILIDSLDEQGYLTDSLADIIDHTPLEWMLDEDDMQEALDRLQTFDPPGVAAATLNESLLLQLQHLSASPECRCAAKIIMQHLDELGKSRTQNQQKLKRKLPDFEADIIEAALSLIATLNPYPAYGFATAEPTAYVQPDVWVREHAGGWRVIGNEKAWPHVRLNQEYCVLLKESRNVDQVWKDKLS